MLRFNKIRLTGFKSFVDPTELLIEPGLTGVVGPNGCGKSNLVEALRWVMGETSAKQMRGSGMDDVIFGGTASRPARNVAEVVLGLDNTARVAPAAFNDFEDLEISRRIEREKGSSYKVNGKDVRARDVQLLFADAATGARSPALVSQGRIGTIISAKPAQRRILLEEAAGIAGLHSRRHEAELRLRGAETNLERLDDILVTLDSQLAGLKKQARQANRYRNLSDHIRKAEATLYHLRWLAITFELTQAREQLATAETKVNELTGRAGGATARQAEESARLPQLRQVEAEAAAELHRLVVARESLDAEEARIAESIEDAKMRLQQTAHDMEREKILLHDAQQAVTRLEGERADMGDPAEGEQNLVEEARFEMERAREAVNELDGKVTALTERVAADEARRGGLEQAAREMEDRRQRLATRVRELKDKHTQLQAESHEAAQLEEAEARMAEAREALEEARLRAEEADIRRAESAEQAEAVAQTARDAEAQLTRQEAEESALADMVATSATGNDDWPPVLDQVTAQPGYESALGAAFGEDLNAPAQAEAPVHWADLGPLADSRPLPGSAEPLSRFVQAPGALARGLSQIGVVDDAATAQSLVRQLAPGQRLVSRDGGLWRWDGFTVAAGAPTAAAVRLEQQNRLAQLRDELLETRARAEEAGLKAEQARDAANRAQEDERAARGTVHAADAAHNQARDAVAAIKERAVAQSSRLAALAENLAGAEEDLEETTQQAEEARFALEELPTTDDARVSMETLRAELAERRAALLDKQTAHDVLLRAAEQRRHRLQAIDDELESWRRRRASAESQQEQLQDRRETLTEELERHAARPAEIAEQRDALAEQLEQSEHKRRTAADALAEAERRAADADQAARSSEMELAGAREDRVRAEGAVQQARQAAESLMERVREKLDCAPEQLPDIAGLKPDEEPPALEAIEKRVDRLIRERDTMGPVNLRAEQESNDLIEQIDGLNMERSDLIEAIEKLRKGIAELNREGRQRLLASFEEVDRHFQDLFVRLFGGGRAHLELVESDDPLEAGLEIMASPPGKRLQSLSLLSGGEQALTATALIFAVFLTNPAPICVLDEVDAPLDDANVDRFCTMLDEMADTSGTRFVVITHHRMTMARMHRLFGVTMGERGVSQLVSVDLQRAEELRATA